MDTQQPDKERTEAFLKEYGELRDRHKMDFIAYPVFVPNQERNTFELMIQPQVVDIGEQPIKSPFVPE